MTLRWSLTPHFCWEHMCNSTQGSLYLSPIKICQSMWIQWPFFKNLNQRSLNPRWPLTLSLLRSHVWLYPMIIVSKSHGNTSMYVDTVINFAKYATYYVQTTCIQSYSVQNEWSHFWIKFRRDKRQKSASHWGIYIWLKINAHSIFEHCLGTLTCLICKLQNCEMVIVFCYEIRAFPLLRSFMGT